MAGAPLNAATSTRVQVTGTVTTEGEAVRFVGPVALSSKTIVDQDFAAARTVQVSIDMRAVTGVGVATGIKYVTDSRETVSVAVPDHGASVADIDFVFAARDAKQATAPGVGHASFSLSFSGRDNAIDEAHGQIDSPATTGVNDR